MSNVYLLIPEFPNSIFGEKLREQVEERLKFYESGDVPRKNVDVMKEACELSFNANAMHTPKKEKKKKKKKNADGSQESQEESQDDGMEVPQEAINGNGKSKKKKRKRSEMEEEANDVEVKEEPVEEEEPPAKKKKKKAKKE